MSVATARELFIDELKDIYSAEKLAVREEEDDDDEDEEEDNESNEDEEDEEEEEEETTNTKSGSKPSARSNPKGQR